MLSLLLSYSYFTREYQFGTPLREVLDAVEYGGGYLYSISSDSFSLFMAVDSLGNVREVANLPPVAGKVRRLKVLSNALWGEADNEALYFVWPDSVIGVRFDPDTVASILPLGGDTALVLLFVPAMSFNFYRLVLVAGSSAVSAANLSLYPDGNFWSGDMGSISSVAIALAMVEDDSILYVASVNRNLTDISWVKRIELPSYAEIFPDDIHLDVLPDGKVVVAYTLDSANSDRWAYTLLSPSGEHIATAMIYPASDPTSNHHVHGVRALDGGKFALFGFLSSSTTHGGVVILDTSGNVLSSYVFNSSRQIPGLSYAPSGFVLLGEGSAGSTVVLLRQAPDFGPCDTSSVSVLTTPVSVSVDDPSLSMTSWMPSYSSVRRHLTPVASPTVSTPCSASVAVPDTVSPTVLSTYPLDGSTNVPETATVRIVFSEPINVSTFNTTNVSLSPAVSYTPSCLSPDTCVITHSPFPSGATVIVTLSSGITDTAGNPLIPAPYVLSFTTAAPPPGSVKVVLTSPDSGEINVPLNANIGVWFSDEIDTTTVNGGSVHIRGWDGSSVVDYSFTVSCPTALFCVLDPSPLFRPSEEVTVMFTDSIKDRTGTISLTPRTITFRTQEVDTLRPVVVFTSPDSGAISVPVNTSIGVQFSRDMDTTTVAGNVEISGDVSGSHGYFVSCPTASYCNLNPYPDFTAGENVTVVFTDGITDRDGRRLVPKTVIFTVGSGEDNDPPTVQIIAPPNDTLTLYNAGELIRAYVSDPGGIQRVDWVLLDQTYSKPTNCAGNLYGSSDTSCLAMPGVPPGVYLLKAFAYDRSNNVGYDSVWVAFNDTVPPYLLLTEPSDGDVGISPHTDIRLVFSENMDTSTFGAVSISVGSSTYSYTHLWEDMQILRLSPSSPFPYDSVVRVVVSSFTDLAGNPMVPDTFSFRIVSNASVSAVIISVSPDTVFVGSGDSVEVRGVVLSTYPITGADLILDGESSFPMVAIDGAYDEVEETVAVKIYTEKEGAHTVVIRGRNAYDYGTSPTANFYVLKVPFLSKDNVVVYPNPAKGRAKVRFVLGDDAYATIEVFDLKARRVFHKEDMYEGFRSYTVDLPNLPPGLYLLRIKAKGQKVERWFSVVR